MKKCIILSENMVSDQNFDNTYRNTGAMEVAGLFRKYGIDTTIFDWFFTWTNEELAEGIDLWFKNSDEQIIGISTPFDLGIVYRIKDVLFDAKKKYPKLQILIGGNRTHDTGLDDVADLVFMGRSIETLIAWLENSDMSKFGTTHPSVIINPDTNFNIDIPVLPPIVDHDFINEYDVLGFEIGIGCKFNCSFCSYDLRGVKNPLFVDSESLREFLQSNYDRYGVKNYYIADDTLNESDEKLTILADALEQLTFEPNLVSFLRVDLLEMRPQQYEMLRRIKLKGVTMGIETLTPAASKIIRKSPKTELTVKALKKLDDLCPDMYKSTGMIIGLTGDTKEDFWNNINRMVNETLVHGLYPSPLRIRVPKGELYEEGYLSDFAKDPKKFGYKIVGSYDLDYTSPEQAGSELLSWENDWTNSKESDDMCREITEHFQKIKVPLISAFEWITLLAFGIVKSPADHKLAGNSNIYKISATRSKKHKQKYVATKLNWLRTL